MAYNDRAEGVRPVVFLSGQNCSSQASDRGLPQQEPSESGLTTAFLFAMTKTPAELKARRRATDLAWRLANPEKHKKNGLDWKKQNQEEHRAHSRKSMEKYRLLHPDRARYPESKEVKQTRMNRRRARLAAVECTLTAAEWKSICDKQGGKCLACGKKCKLSMDHIVPLSRGGAHSADNIQGLCRTCNNRKFTKTVDYRQPEQLQLAFSEVVQALADTLSATGKQRQAKRAALKRTLKAAR